VEKKSEYREEVRNRPWKNERYRKRIKTGGNTGGLNLCVKRSFHGGEKRKRRGVKGNCGQRRKRGGDQRHKKREGPCQFGGMSGRTLSYDGTRKEFKKDQPGKARRKETEVNHRLRFSWNGLSIAGKKRRRGKIKKKKGVKNSGGNGAAVHHEKGGCPKNREGSDNTNYKKVAAERGRGGS